MGEVAACLLVFALLLLAAEAGRAAARRHPAMLENPDALDAMRRTVALLVPMTALVLGLLVSGGKASFDAQAASVSKVAASTASLDEYLRHYGDEADPVRKQLREATGAVVASLWEEHGDSPEKMAIARNEALDFLGNLSALEPSNTRQETLKSAAIGAATEIVEERFHLATIEHVPFPMPIILVIAFWLSAVFSVHAIGTPPATGVRAVEVSVALAAATAIWLIFELHDPFRGVLQISRQPLEVLAVALG